MQESAYSVLPDSKGISSVNWRRDEEDPSKKLLLQLNECQFQDQMSDLSKIFTLRSMQMDELFKRNPKFDLQHY